MLVHSAASVLILDRSEAAGHLDEDGVALLFERFTADASKGR